MKRKSKPKPSPIPEGMAGEQRLNKLLAAAGLGSRRQVDELIEQGRVEVDGKVCEQLGTKVDPAVSKITVDGIALKRMRPVYYALNKPSGVLCTNRDPQGRRRAVDFIPGKQRLYPVGRLDASSIGLLLLTNDGELTQQLTHPKHGVPKTYFVVVAGQMESDEIRRLRRGIHLAEGIARVEFVKIRKVRKSSTELEITLTEGKNREIRRVLARLGHKVVTLCRLSIGPLRLGNLPEGAYRPLSSEEVAQLYRAAEDARKARRVRQKELDEKKSERASRAETSKRAGASPKGSKRTSSDIDDASNSMVAPSALQSSDHDPFAWDDDDALLAANPFGPGYAGDADDANEEDDGWIEAPGGSEEGDELEEPATHQGILVDDRSSMKQGKILDYQEAEDGARTADRKPRGARGGGGGRTTERPFRKKSAFSRSSSGRPVKNTKRGGDRPARKKKGGPASRTGDRPVGKGGPGGRKRANQGSRKGLNRGKKGKGRTSGRSRPS